MVLADDNSGHIVSLDYNMEVNMAFEKLPPTPHFCADCAKVIDGALA